MESTIKIKLSARKANLAQDNIQVTLEEVSLEGEVALSDMLISIFKQLAENVKSNLAVAQCSNCNLHYDMNVQQNCPQCGQPPRK